jgi:hypothetical protein
MFLVGYRYLGHTYPLYQGLCFHCASIASSLRPSTFKL